HREHRRRDRGRHRGVDLEGAGRGRAAVRRAPRARGAHRRRAEGRGRAMRWSRANRRKAARARRALPKLPKIRIRWRAVLVPPLVVAALGAGAVGAKTLLDRPVRTLTLEGAFQRVTPLAIEAAVAPELGRGFLSLD